MAVTHSLADAVQHARPPRRARHLHQHPVRLQLRKGMFGMTEFDTGHFPEELR